jgi:predicted nucleic acid-binding Zn finger protein
MSPRRLSDSAVVEVRLTRLCHTQINNRVLMSDIWVLLESTECAGHQKGMISIETHVFRRQLAYVDSDQRIHMDATGDHVPISDQIALFQIVDVLLGAYVLSLDKRYCSCRSYRYLRTEHGDRNCKHLNSICRPSYTVVYTKQKQSFQLISETVPKNQSVYMDWIYSLKHDGIRVRVEGTYAWTRGGMRIDLSDAWTPPVGYVYDAELCVVGATPSTHDRTLAMILSGKTGALKLVLFDLFDTTGSLTCAQRLICLWSLPIPAENLVRYHMVNLWKGPSFHTRLGELNIGSPECEGIIVRNPGTLYDGSGSRNSRSIFKIKDTQWNLLRVRTHSNPGLRLLTP